jgi:hypothetical protein
MWGARKESVSLSPPKPRELAPMAHASPPRDSKAQAIPSPPRLSDQNLRLQSLDEDFRILLQRMHHLEEAEAKRTASSFKKKDRKDREEKASGRRRSRGKSSSPTRNKIPGLDEADKAKKVKMKRALTKRYGKDKAHEMRKEAQSVAEEYFEDRGNEQPELPGAVWQE